MTIMKLDVDPNTPLCTSPDDIASWAMPGAEGVPTCHPDPTATELLTQPWIQDARSGLAGQVRTLSTYFISTPDPHVGNVNGTMTEVVAFIDGSLKYFVGALMVISLIISAIKVMIDRDKAAQVKGVLMMLLLAMANQGGTLALIAFCLLAASVFSVWILEQSTVGTTFADNLIQILAGPGGGAAGIVQVILLILAAIIAFFLCIMLIFRGAVLFVRTGVLLLSGSLYSTDIGKQIWRENIGAIFAFILFKPTAAIIFATGFKLLSTDLASQDGGQNYQYGVALLILAMFALPALQRVVTPLVAPAASGQGAGAVAGAALTTFAYGGMRAFMR